MINLLLILSDSRGLGFFQFYTLKEVKDVLQNVVLRNMVRESLHVKREAFEGWRRVVEVVLASCPGDILPKDTRQAVISDVLQDLLAKVQYPDQSATVFTPEYKESYRDCLKLAS